jgi:translation initiation factor IF-1
MESIKKKIEERIESGKMTIKPRSLYILKRIFIILIFLLLAIFSLFFSSFGFFALKSGGIFSLPNIGFGLIPLILLNLPWITIILLVILVVTTELFGKKYSIVYKWPLIYSLFVFVVFLGIGGLVLAQSGIHEKISDSARKERLGIFGPGYKKLEDVKPKSLNFGEVIEAGESRILVRLEDEEEVEVTINDKTRGRVHNIAVGDIISIIGEIKDGSIMAKGIKEIKEGSPFGRKFRRNLNMRPAIPPLGVDDE